MYLVRASWWHRFGISYDLNYRPDVCCQFLEFFDYFWWLLALGKDV